MSKSSHDGHRQFSLRQHLARIPLKGLERAGGMLAASDRRTLLAFSTEGTPTGALPGSGKHKSWLAQRKERKLQYRPNRRVIPQHATSIAAQLASGERVAIETDLGQLDVVQGLDGVPTYDELRARATEAEVLGIRVLVCSVEDLRAMKQAAGRTRDQADLEDLEAAGH